MGKQISAVQALESKNTFYAKRFQQNGYYPIQKFVYDKKSGCYEQFVQKGKCWHSLGIAFKEPLTCNNGDVVTNKSWWLYIFEHNSYKLSLDEMRDNYNYNLE